MVTSIRYEIDTSGYNGQVIKAIIFDVDGVLIDSAEANAQFFHELLTRFGYQPTPDPDHQKHNHLPMWDRIALMTGSDDPKVIQPIWEYGRDRADYPLHLVKPPEQLTETLKELKRTYVLGVVTGRIREGLDEFFKLTKSRSYFGTMVTYEDTTKRKPYPEPLLKAAESLGVRPAECMYVGDADTDVQAANAAGMASVLVAQHDNPDADQVIRRWDDLPAAIDGLALAAQ
jgi:beta-phosphoglucomutase-like phosphatase (HAD superfamily)